MCNRFYHHIETYVYCLYDVSQKKVADYNLTSDFYLYLIPSWKDKLIRKRLYLSLKERFLNEFKNGLPDITVLAVTVNEVRLAGGVCRASL